MYKLVIIIAGADAQVDFDTYWPQFLHLAEQMPGLRREATGRVARVLFGSLPCTLIHELFFDSLDALQEAMASPVGQETGQLLQQMTRGKLTLLVSDHNEDDLENIRKHRLQKDKPQESPK